jgi:hypothetical protein
MKKNITPNNSPPSFRIKPDLMTLAFKCEFKDKDRFVYNKLVYHIQTLVSTWVGSSSLTAPIFVLCNSSGYGKTKILFEYASEHVTLFICLRRPGTNGYPARSITADLLTEAIRSNKTQQFLKIYVITAIELINEIKKLKPELKRECDYALEFRNYQQWINSHEPEKTQKFIELLKQNLINDKIDERFKNTSSFVFQSKKCDLTVVIDEAHFLNNEVLSDNRSFYRHFRQATREAFTGYNIAFVLTSTCSSIFDFHIGNQNLTESDRTTSNRVFPPFCELYLCNQIKPIEYEATLTNYCDLNNKKGFYDFVHRRDPFSTFFFYGRPLWASYLQQIKLENVTDRALIIEMARKKLIFANDWHDRQNNKQMSSLAILCTRTCLTSSFKINSCSLKSSLIARYMASLYGYDKNEDLQMMYINEPILSDAAAYYMSDRCILIEILKELNELLTTNSFQSLGSMGEFVSEIILLCARDKAIIDSHVKNEDYMNKNSFSGSITVRQFLKSLINFDKIKIYDENGKILNFNHFSDNLLDGIITFNQFKKKIDILNFNGLIKDSIGSSAALRLSDSFPLFDFIAPIIHKTNSIGCLAVQSKNQSKVDRKSCAKNMILANVFKKKNYNQFLKTGTNIAFKEEESIKLLFSLSQDDTDKSIILHENGTLSIRGLKEFTCLESKDDQLVIQLKNLLNCSRNTFSHMEGELRNRMLMVLENSSSSKDSTLAPKASKSESVKRKKKGNKFSNQ